MSQQHDQPNLLCHADSHADSRPSAPQLAKSDTKIEITSQQVSAVDITNAFTTAASALGTGQLVKDESFTLFEAVAALEIMDSKMDSGHLEPGEALEDEYDVLRKILPEEAIEPKTVEEAQFSRRAKDVSENPLVHQVLRAYCIATIKACHFVHRMVTAESYYEEEDFTSQLYHRELLPKVTAAEVHTLLDEAVSYITIASVSVETGKAIKSRLLFRQSLLKAFEQDWGPLNLRKKSSLTCIPFLRNITETTYLGVPVKDCFSTKIQRSLASSVPPRPMVTIKFSDAFSFFETLCNDVADIDQVLEAETSEDLSTAIWVFMSRAPQPSVYVRALAQSFLMERHTQRVLGKMTSKQFLISSISAIVLPKSPFLESTNAAVEAATGPRFHMARLYSEFDAKLGQQYLNVFRNACLNRCRTRRTLCHLILDWDALQADAEELDATLRTYTEEPPTLYASSQPTFSYPLSSWVYHHKLNQLRAIIQLGFELTIYAPDEFAGMYWYLSYVCGIHLSHIDRVTFFLQRDMGMQDAIPQEFSIEQPDLKDRAQSQKTLKNLFRIYMQLKATEALSKALHAIYIVLLRHEAIKTPPRPYSSDRLRYELRMRPFLSLSVPEPVNFEMFQVESSFSDVEDAHVLEEAAARVAEARKAWDEILKAGWSVTLENTADLDGPSQASKRESREGGTTTESEWSKGVKNIIRTCIATSISLSTLRKKLEKGGDLHEVQCTIPIPGERDCWHDWWIVPRLSNTA